MWRYILACIGVVCIGWSASFALIANDCADAGSYTVDGYIQGVKQQFAEHNRDLLFFTDDDLSTALLHLQKTCCDEAMSSDTICQDMQDVTYNPSSVIMADHLLDVGFRKLDGDQTTCDTLHISCDNRQIVPNKSLEWREKIREIAEDREGYPSIQIQKLFEEYRGNVESHGASMDAVATADRGSVDTLYAQYLLLCDEVDLINTWIVGAQRSLNIALTSDGDQVRSACLGAARKRYEQEKTYVRTLMVEKAIDYYQQNMEGYLLRYFTENRFDGLIDKMHTMNGCFDNVLKYTTNTPCCNQ